MLKSMNRGILSLLLFFGLSISVAYGQGRLSELDSARLARTKEVNFIINQIDSVYIYGRRGLSDSEWDRRVKFIHQKVDSAMYRRDYLFALRYIGLLINDAHFAFPDAGVYNRTRYFHKTDTIFPVWVKTWKDGRVYVVKDFTSILPKNSQIVSVNGHSAQEMALMNRSIKPSEERHAIDLLNTGTEWSPRYWSNFSSFLFMEGMNAPYKIEYIAPLSDKIDTVTIQGISRQSKVKLSKKQLRQNKKPYRIMEYEKIGKTSAVLTLNSFWGRNLIELLIFSKDWTYPRRLKNIMARIDRNKIDTLIIDISENGGGMNDNLYKTLNYFTDKPLDANSTFLVTENNRSIMKRVISNSPYQLFGLNKEQKARLVSFVDSVKSHDSFSTDTIFDLHFTPDSILKHRYTGKVYLVTSNDTYSAAQEFAQAFRQLGIGISAGQACGGYSSISGGNSAYATLSQLGFTFMVPYSRPGKKSDKLRFEYDPVDYPIEIEFDEWLRDENRTLDKFIDMLRSGSLSNIDLPASK